MISLSDLLEYVPDHSRIGIVLKLESGKQTTLYSGYKCNVKKFCDIDDYELRRVYGGSWDSKWGLVIGVKYKGEL